MRTFTTNRTRTTTAIAGSALALALVLGACGSDDADDAATDLPTEPVEIPGGDTATEPTDGAGDDSTSGDSATDGTTTDDSATDSTTDGGDAADSTQLAGVGDLLQAAAAALAEVPGGFVTMVERDDDDSDRYEVDIADGDTLVEITLDASFAIVERDTDDLDGDERAEVDAAELTIDDAVAAAAQAGEIGTADRLVEEIELEDERGRVAWEFDLDNDGEADFYVDATTGEIFRD